MDEILNYIKQKHKQIKDSYDKQTCSLIAKEIAKILLKNGKKPFIITFIKEDSELKPKMYKFGWGVHVVCCCEDMAYDPILPNPILIKDYSKEVFGEEINMRISIPKENIYEFVK